MDTVRKKHLAILRSICETLGKDFKTSAHCQCGELVHNTKVHYTRAQYARLTKKAKANE